MNFQQFVAAVRARWKVALGIFGGVMLLTIVITLLTTSQYKATASVVVAAKTDPVAGALNSAQTMAGYIATQVDIISSKRVAQRAVEDLKLDQMPQFRDQLEVKSKGDDKKDTIGVLADTLSKLVVVTPSRESNVIDIAVEWPDPKMAALLANGFAQAYIETSIELKVEPAKQYAAWFDQRSRELRADLEAKQKRLSDFQNRTGIIATDEKLDIETARLNELSTQLVTIQGLLQDSQSKQRQAGTDNESLPEVLQSPVIVSLKAELAKQEGALQEIAARLGKNHPDYISTQSNIQSLRQRIARESANISASLMASTQVNIRREKDVEAALEAQKKRVLQLRGQHDQASDLQNDVVTAQRNLDAVALQLAQSNLQSESQQADIVLLTPAVEPLIRSSPQRTQNLAFGLFFGVVLSLGTVLVLESFDRRVRSVNDLAGMLGTPILGKVGAAGARS
jgi:chain length determinant protein EpsF